MIEGWQLNVLLLALVLSGGCQRGRPQASAYMRAGDDGVLTIRFPDIGPYRGAEQGAPPPGFRPIRFRIMEPLPAGRISRVKGLMIAEDGTSAPQLLRVGFHARQGEEYDIRKSLGGEGVNPGFEGPFASSRATFEVDVRIPEVPGPVALALVVPVVRSEGPAPLLERRVLAEVFADVVEGGTTSSEFIAQPVDK